MESWALWRAAAGNSPATAAPWRVEICQERLSEIYIYRYNNVYYVYIYNYSHIYYMFFFIYGIRVLVRRQRRKKKEEEEEEEEEGLCVIY